MSDWTDGYVAEVNYTYGYYAELNPLRAVLPLLNVGVAPPPIATACELGFGQGLSLNIHAAASDAAWYGTDFNPAHAGFAQSLAAAAGSGAQLFDQSFEEFCRRADLPEFDFIALHGIWSWISEENQQFIVDFVRRKLKVGGLAYVSYNAQPGAAAMVPFRDLMVGHAEKTPGSGRGLVARIDAAVEFAEKLLALNPAFAAVNPVIADRLKTIKGHNRNYLAHEFFNRDWHAVSFAEMSKSLAAAKLTYAGSAHLLDHVDAINLQPAQQQFLAEIPDPIFRQSVRDFIVNQQFRRDYWIKGAQRLSPLELAEAIKRLRVMLVAAPRADISYSVGGALGTLEMNRNAYEPVIEALGDHRPITVGDVESAVAASGMRLGGIYETLIVLAGKGDLALVQDEAAQERAKSRTDRLNLHLFGKARSSPEIAFLASPVSGGGIAVPRFHQLFLLARRHGRTGVEELAQFAWDIVTSQGHRVVKDGKPLETPEDNLAELTSQARDFVDKRLTLLQALQIA